LQTMYFKQHKFMEYQVTENTEVTLKQFVEATRDMTEKERRAAMSMEERDRADVNKEVAKEQASAPKMLAGLVALKIKAHASFDDAMKELLAGENKCVVGKLAGDKGEELAGELLSDIAKVSDLKGKKLPEDVPCYVILKADATRLVLISWLPEYCPVKLRMKCSTFKASVIDHIKELCPDIETIQQAETSEEDDLEDRLTDAKKAPPGGMGMGMGGGKGGYQEPPKEEEGGKSPGGWKPPPGAMRMPGMPPGGMKMPGM